MSHGPQAWMLRCIAAIVNGLAWTGIVGLATWLGDNRVGIAGLAVTFVGITAVTLGGLMLLGGGREPE